MRFSLFSSPQLPSMPWKNGGGTTREITCQPAGAGLDDFHWRLSIAEIAASGPFSAFAGIDRVITLLEGDGVRLYTQEVPAPQAIDHALQRPLEPFAFAGDTALQCTLLGGTCQDFNVMVRRSFGSPHVATRTHAWALPAQGALLVRHGQWQVQLADGSIYLLDADAQDGAWWSHLPGACSAQPLSADAVLLAVTIHPHS